MKHVKVTELRAHLPEYLGRVKTGETIVVVSRGQSIARLVPAAGVVEEARARLAGLRKKARIGDIVAPIGVKWNATHDRT
jgi:prevent-host-death family protein